MCIYLETTVEKRFNTIEEAQAFGAQMDKYGNVAARPDCITRDDTKFMLKKYHEHAVLNANAHKWMRGEFTDIPALFPNQAFVHIEED